MAKLGTREMTCKYCGTTWTLRAPTEDLDLYLNYCKACWENDEPGMARFNRMAEMFGPAWALEHYGPIA
jgi:hypothetical protein